MEPLRDWSIFEASRKELSSSEKFVLLVVKRHIGKNGFATVSHECIAEETSLTRPTVVKLMNSIDRKKWITTTKRKHKINGYVCHEYRLNEDKFIREKKNNLTCSVNSLNNPQSNDFTEVCKISLHKDNNIKINKTKIKDQDFAGEPAQASPAINPKPIVQTS